MAHTASPTTYLINIKSKTNVSPNGVGFPTMGPPPLTNNQATTQNFPIGATNAYLFFLVSVDAGGVMNTWPVLGVTPQAGPYIISLQTPGSLLATRVTANLADVIIGGQPGATTISSPSYRYTGEGLLELTIPWLPGPGPGDQPTALVAAAEFPDRSQGGGLVTLALNASTPIDGTTSLTGIYRPDYLGKQAVDVTNPQAIIVTAPAPKAAMTVRLFLFSCLNSWEDTETTAQATIAVAAPTVGKPASGAEYTLDLATWGSPAFLAPVQDTQKGGTSISYISFNVVEPNPTGASYAGWQIISQGWPNNPGTLVPETSIKKGVAYATIGDDTPTSVVTITYYLVSAGIDANGKLAVNTVVPGFTPSVQVQLGTTQGVLDLRQSLVTSFNNAEFHVDPNTFLWSMNNLDFSKATSFSTQFAIIGNVFSVTTLDASIVITGYLQVGGGGNKVSQIRIFDAAGVDLLGWIGDDTVNVGQGTPSGFAGAWFKRVLIGGSNPGNAPFVADSLGNVAIQGSLLTGPITIAGPSTQTVNLFTVLNGSNNPVMWAGKKDNGLGGFYYGLWASNLWIGGTYPGDAPMWVDANGNVVITQANLSITGTGSGINCTLSTSPQTLDATYGSLALTNADLTDKTAFVTRGLIFYNNGSKVGSLVRSPNGSYLEMECSPGGGGYVLINGAGGTLGGIRSDNGYLVGATRVISSASAFVGTGADMSGVVRSTGYVQPVSGVGVEIEYQAGTGFLQAINRSTATYIPLHLEGLPITLNAAIGAKVGIGTATPQATLHSVGSTILGAPNSQLVTLANMGNSQVQIWLNEAGNLLTFTVKNSAGVLKTATIAVS